MTEKPKNLFYFVGNHSDFCSQTNFIKGLIVMNFYATWSPNYLKIGDQIVNLANENSKITFFSIDIDQSRDVTNFFCINTVPTVKILNKTRKGIEEVFSFTGVDQKMQEILQEKIKELITNFHY